VIGCTKLPEKIIPQKPIRGVVSTPPLGIRELTQGCATARLWSRVWQTDGQTPRRWQRRAKHSAVARKNSEVVFRCLPHRFMGFVLGVWLLLRIPTRNSRNDLQMDSSAKPDTGLSPPPPYCCPRLERL